MGSLTGLLILTQPVRRIKSTLPQVLKAASQHVEKTLYVHLDPLAQARSLETKQRISVCSHIITSLYSQSGSQCGGLDVRVLMAGFKGIAEVPSRTSFQVDQVLFDEVKEGNELTDLEKRYKSFLTGSKRKAVVLFDRMPEGFESLPPENIYNEKANNVYTNVVLGGTFDLIHDGHKILLCESLLRCSERITIGIADGPLLKNKTLKELIAPCDNRISKVKDLLSDLDPTVEQNVVQILEPMGPAAWDKRLQMIVVSEETKKGITLINNARQDAGLNILDGYIISLVEDKCRVNEEEETKISASSLRMRKLGTLIKPVKENASIPSTPYIIGLTGGSASGKSSVAKRFANLGAGIVDCDELGHKAYMKGTQCYDNLIKEFGIDIVSEDGEINRRALGSKVFNNKEALEKLNNLVWPEIARLAKECIRTLSESGTQVIILDAAVLLEANWQQFCHQVWVCIIKREEAITRIMERDGKSREDAERRIDNQISNEERVSHANMVFCTQWSGEYTQQQCEKAWKVLLDMLDQEVKSQL